MNIKRVALPSLFAAICLAFAAPPVYPGAKPIDELNDAAKKAGQNTMAYQTPDSFEKVSEFYKGKGGSETQGRHSNRAGEKFVTFRFPEGYAVAISWKEDSKKNGTIIHIGQGGGR
jgi:hypothetical protein